MSADNQQGRTREEAGNYIAGFVDGEGSFSITVQRSKNVRLGIQIIPEFHACQHSNRTETLEFIKEHLRCGYLKPNHRKNPNDLTWVFVVRDLKNLQEKVIPFFMDYPLIAKRQDFGKFRNIVNMMDKKLHLTKNGLAEILKIAFSMNSSGKYRKLSLKELLLSL
ncbi:MAG: LAGLIDADG family homing endonuclease [Candidatus Omnitrophota bacterium]|nr:MAG: LAGLIDADG family homing endonuclease [Candidatus Omnitrophota bacterium]